MDPGQWSIWRRLSRLGLSESKRNAASVVKNDEADGGCVQRRSNNGGGIRQDFTKQVELAYVATCQGCGRA